jgi:hypothetical protein
MSGPPESGICAAFGAIKYLGQRITYLKCQVKVTELLVAQAPMKWGVNAGLLRPQLGSG